jgi:hypothetical protein
LRCLPASIFLAYQAYFSALFLPIVVAACQLTEE